MCQICSHFRPMDPECAYEALGDLVAKPIATVDPGDPIETGVVVSSATYASYTMSPETSFDARLDDIGQADMIAIELDGSTTYSISLVGLGPDGLNDPYLRIYDADGTLVTWDDDGGTGTNSALEFSPALDGTYLLEVRGYNDSHDGDYRLTVEASSVDYATIDELAAYLTDGFWEVDNNVRHSYDTSSSNTITVYLGAISSDGRRLAEAALEAWEQVADIHFEIVSDTNADMRFQESDPSGAYAYYGWRGSPSNIDYSVVNIPTGWLDSNGRSYDSYSLQTYIHEIGHALGLGHQGDYNGSASFPGDAGFANDSWQASVMSYFSQTENTNIDATLAHVITPMAADILAIQTLYGAADASTAAWGGNTVYGVGQTIGGYLGEVMDQAVAGTTSATYDGNTGFAFTVYDTDGIDHFNFNYSDRDLLIDLREERTSNVFRETESAGERGNLVIARGTVIEHATGGTGDDTIIGNDADNLLTGFLGDDHLVGGGGDDLLFGSQGRDTLEGGTGADTLFGDFVNLAQDGDEASIYRLYKAILDRAPDLQGHANWLGHLQNGNMSLAEIADGFMAGAEFTQTYGSTTNSEFVTLLYQNVLDRNPDQNGLNNWVGQLDSGSATRGEVVLGFSNSAEFIGTTEAGAYAFGDTAAESAWTGQVWRLYQATLDRNPDLQGFANWTGKLADGDNYLDVASGFINSVEFQSIYGNTTSTEFVTLLYQNVLGRNPDQGGLNNWVGQLDSGARDRTEVLRGFAESAEFVTTSFGVMSEWITENLSGDRLIAEGADILVGATGADTFVFDADLGIDARVVGMEAWDIVELASTSFGSSAAAHAALVQVGDDVVLSDGTMTITFLDRLLANFAEDQFDLV